MARAARLSGKKSDEEKEIEEDMSKNSFIGKATRFIQAGLMKYGFFAILCCASIPNPLFDLAGITCGHFLIPFWTFFIATAIGKSIIKTHLQMVFVIIVFSEQHVENLLAFIERTLPFFKNYLTNILDKQK